MTLPVFLHIEAAPKQVGQAFNQAYWCRLLELIETYGGIEIATYHVEKVLLGDSCVTLFKVISFANRQQLDTLFASQAYQAVAPLAKHDFIDLRFCRVHEKLDLSE